MHGRSSIAVIAAGGLALAFAELVPVAVAAENMATAERPATSIGAGTTIVPVPQRVVILPATLPTFGRPLLSANFSCHVFLR